MFYYEQHVAEDKQVSDTQVQVHAQLFLITSSVVHSINLFAKSDVINIIIYHTYTYLAISLEILQSVTFCIMFKVQRNEGRKWFELKLFRFLSKKLRIN